MEEVQPHEADLRSYLRGRFPSHTDLDDLVQESYARLFRAHASGPIACARAFLFVTARNLALNCLRRRVRERADEPTELDVTCIVDENTEVRESIARTEDLGLLLQAIQSLPNRCRQIITLRKVYGLSQREVAERLGISERTVEAQGAIGLRKCVEFFRRHGHPFASRS